MLFPVKSGKEATVWVAEAHPDRPERFLALKHYTPLAHRNFRNDAAYREGRFVPDARAARAMRNGTRKGRQFAFGDWIGHEHATLAALHRAGADVPRPVASNGSALLIELIGEGSAPAPMLASVRLAQDEAEAALLRLLANIATMLANGIVHGDLSPYNVLWDRAARRPVVIDLPQSVDARANPNARAMLGRDVANVCRYFARQGVASEPDAITDDLWTRWQHARL